MSEHKTGEVVWERQFWNGNSVLKVNTGRCWKFLVNLGHYSLLLLKRTLFWVQGKGIYLIPPPCWLFIKRDRGEKSAFSLGKKQVKFTEM